VSEEPSSDEKYGIEISVLLNYHTEIHKIHMLLTKLNDLYLERPWKILKYSDAKLQNEKIKISAIRRSLTHNGREARVHSGLTKF